jgi:hypothetical protein
VSNGQRYQVMWQEVIAIKKVKSFFSQYWDELVLFSEVTPFVP